MMPADVVRAELKVVGKSGQISLGKRFVGKTLRLEERGDGTIVLTAVAVIPESQLWTLESPHRERIARALEWAAEHPARESDLAAVVSRARAAGRRAERRRGRRK
jgi:hypothetical protein